VVFLINRR